MTDEQEKQIATELNHLNGYIIKRSAQGAPKAAQIEAMKLMLERLKG